MTNIGRATLRDREAVPPMPTAFAFPILPLLRAMFDVDRDALPIHCLEGISGGSSEASSALLGKYAARFSAPPSVAWKMIGSMSIPYGKSAICRRSAASTPGPMPSIWSRGFAPH